MNTFKVNPVIRRDSIYDINIWFYTNELLHVYGTFSIVVKQKVPRQFQNATKKCRVQILLNTFIYLFHSEDEIKKNGKVTKGAKNGLVPYWVNQKFQFVDGQLVDTCLNVQYVWIHDLL